MRYLVFALILLVLVAGCTSQKTINPSQTGTIEIIDYSYASQMTDHGNFTVFAKNIGNNKLSGTIDYTIYSCSNTSIATKSAEFYDINPGDPIKVIINLGNIEKDYYDVSCYWTLNAGQKITTTGSGPRVIPKK